MVNGGHVLEVVGGEVLDLGGEGKPACAEPEKGEEADPSAVLGVGASAMPIEDAQAEGHGDNLEGDDGEGLSCGHDEAGDGVEFDHTDGFGEEERHLEIGEADESASDDEKRDAERASVVRMLESTPGRGVLESAGMGVRVRSMHGRPLRFVDGIGRRWPRGKGRWSEACERWKRENVRTLWMEESGDE